MNLLAYLSMKLRCTEAEAQCILHVRDTMKRLAADKAWGDGIHVLAVTRGRDLERQARAQAVKAKRNELFGASNEAYDLPLRLHGIISQVDALEDEFTKPPKPKRQEDDE